jgi:phage gpG-like protein
MVNLSVVRQGEGGDAEKMLVNLRKDMPAIDRTLRNLFALQIVGNIQKNYLRGQVLHRHSGDLATSIDKVDRTDNETMVGSYGVVYARIHELGGRIKPKVKKCLRFKTERGWVTTKLVRMPKRPYILPGILTYFTNGEAEREAEKYLQRELDKRAAR